MDKAKISYRIPTSNWEEDYHFSNLCVLLDEYKDKIDEISLFLGFTHLTLPIERVEELTKILKNRIVDIKKLGLRTGINHLCTIGHINENIKNSLQGDYGRFVDYDGNVSQVLCVSDPNVQKYIKTTYELLAKAEPDYIWIDDDVRMYGHSNGVYGCFCDRCMEVFSKKIGEDVDFEKFKYITNNGSSSDKKKYRKLWLEFNSDQVSFILSIARNAVDSVNPNINVGLMSADFNYENLDQKRFSDILSRNNTIDTMWRPGGGFYKDWNKEMFVKASGIGRQIASYPKYICDIQSEIENFPYNHLQKSVFMNILEACAYIGAGCTGIAYNVMYPDSYESKYSTSYENSRRFSGILPKRDFMDLLVKTFKRNENRGIFIEYSKDSMTSMNMESGEWLKGNGKKFPTEIFESGLPLTYYKDKADVTFLFDEEPLGMEREDILNLLSGGVFMNGVALDNLIKLGYGEYLGFKISNIIEDDAQEQFTDHKLNGDFAGFLRDSRQSFKWWAEAAYGITKTDDKAEVLATLVDYKNKKFTNADGDISCSMGIYENSLGGRICISGYFTNSYVQSYAKASQLKNIMKYLSKDTLSSYVDSYHNILLFDRSADSVAMLLINYSYDSAENLEICISGDIKEISTTNVDMETKKIKQDSFDGAYSKFIIPKMDMWSMLLIKG